MFNSARLKLTGWYLLIIMSISLSFSLVLYRVLTLEINRLVERQRARIEQQLNNPDWFPPPNANRFRDFYFDETIVAEVKQRLMFNFLFVNALILIGAGGLGYILAGKTLQPIQVALEEQRRFVSDASHELRTPLTALQTSLEVALRDKKLTLSGARQELQSSLQDVRGLERLSGALLELARLEDGSSIVQQEPSVVTIVVGVAIQTVQSLAAQKQITFMNESNSDHRVYFSAEKFQEVLVILFDNAIKYSAQQTEVVVRSRRTDGHVNISVVDQGIGIPAEIVPHIFDRFFQAEASRSAGQTRAGYGLGLAIARKLVMQAGGTISVQSQPSKGTTFTLRLKAV